jgi:hypothetical protein
LNAPSIPLPSNDIGTSSFEASPVGDWSDAMQKLAAAVSMNSEVGKVSTEELIRWGEPKNGLQAGLLIPTAVTHGEQIEARLVLRKITGAPEQLTLNGRHVQLVAHAADRIHPAILDSLLVPLRPQVVVALRAGEHLEFPNRRIQFGGSQLPDIRESMFIGSLPGIVSVKFKMLQPDGPPLETGEVEIQVNEDKAVAPGAATTSLIKEPQQPISQSETDSRLKLRPIELNRERLIELARGKNKQTAFRFVVQTDAGRVEVTPGAAGQMRIVRDKLEMFAGELTLVSSPEHLQISASVN